ncbi:hypothetical protein [Marinobacter nauticus]|uniref:hypothetical protein n=1 Tax=Marinobacter nauticus TaxID=2743 RepID=UPI000EAF89FE|nr:hypothetical protein [Marinobacter nauticus]RKR79586.1 hypothetical protein C7436_1037 [Marinobacter nauticus]
MSIEVCAYNYHLVEMRFHRIRFDIPSYDRIDNNGGDLSIETNLRFGVDSNSLYCTVTAFVKIIPEGQDDIDSDDKVIIEIELAGTGRFDLGADHGITSKRLNELEHEEVVTFSNVIDPLIVSKLREILLDAGIDSITIPLQLRPVQKPVAE